MYRAAVAFIAVGVAAIAHAQIDTAILRPVGYHPGPIAYYNAPYFANALYEGGEWLSFTGSEFGSSINFNSDQFENGYPKFLQGAQKLRAIVFGLNIDNPYRPPGWPSRARLARGRIVVTWKGNADIRLTGCHFSGDAAQSSGTFTALARRRL